MAKNNCYRPREHRSTDSKCVLLHYQCLSIDTVSSPTPTAYLDSSIPYVRGYLNSTLGGFAHPEAVKPLGEWCSSRFFFDSTHHNALVRFLGENYPRMLKALGLLANASRPFSRSESSSLQELYKVCVEHAADIRRIHDKIMEEQNGLK